METLSSRYFLALYRYGPENIQAHTNLPDDKKWNQCHFRQV